MCDSAEFDAESLSRETASQLRTAQTTWRWRMEQWHRNCGQAAPESMQSCGVNHADAASCDVFAIGRKALCRDRTRVPRCHSAHVVRESIQRAGIAPKEVGQVVFGNVIHTELADMYLSRVAAVRGGVPIEAPALTLNRLCDSGLQAIISAAQTSWLVSRLHDIVGFSECLHCQPIGWFVRCLS